MQLFTIWRQHTKKLINEHHFVLYKYYFNIIQIEERGTIQFNCTTSVCYDAVLCKEDS